MPLYVKDWFRAFEYSLVARNQRIEWRRKPCTHDSVRFRRLMQTPAGRDAYCVFNAAVDMVARKRLKGVLADAEGRPIGPREVADSSAIPLPVCVKAFRLLQSTDIAWLGTDPAIRGPEPVSGAPPATDAQQTSNGRATNGCPVVAPELEAEQSKASALPEKTLSGQGKPSIAVPQGARISVRWETPCPALPELERVLDAITECGVDVAEAAAMLAIPGAKADALYHAAKRTRSEQAGGKDIKSPRTYILSIAGLHVSKRRQAEDAITNRRLELARLAGRRA